MAPTGNGAALKRDRYTGFGSLPWKMPNTHTSSADLRTNRSWRDTWLDWSWIFASMPTIFAGILLTHAVHLWSALGRWPATYRDYPPARFARILLDIHELGLVAPGFWLTVLAVPLWFLAAVLARPGLIKQTFGRQALVFLLGVGLLCGIIYALSWTFYPQWLLD
jgi:hypothetical protein